MAVLLKNIKLHAQIANANQLHEVLSQPVTSMLVLSSSWTVMYVPVFILSLEDLL